MTTSFKIGQNAALEKFAARRGLMEIRNALGGGNLARAQRLATTPGVLKPTNTMGSQIKDLGAGGEGLATLVAHPEHGIAVRKAFDPNAGVYSNDLISRKAQLGSLPGSAKFLGQAQSQLGSPVHFNEYVNGTQVTDKMLKSDPQVATQYLRSMRSSHQAAAKQGFKLRDTRAANAMLTPEGQVKFIDSLPFKKDELPTNGESHQMRKLHGANTVVTTKDMFGPEQRMPGIDPRINVNNRNLFKKHMFGTGGNLPKQELPMLPPLDLGQSSNVLPTTGKLPTIARPTQITQSLRPTIANRSNPQARTAPIKRVA
jgi:serine/threonine protein kinase